VTDVALHYIERADEVSEGVDITLLGNITDRVSLFQFATVFIASSNAFALYTEPDLEPSKEKVLFRESVLSTV